MDAETIAALPEARAYAEWLNAQAAAREAVIEAVRAWDKTTYPNSQNRYYTGANECKALKQALAALDGLNPPAALDQTRELATVREEMLRGETPIPPPTDDWENYPMSTMLARDKRDAEEAYHRGMQEAGNGFGD